MDNVSTTPEGTEAKAPSPTNYDELVTHPDARLRRAVVFDPAVGDEILIRLKHDSDPVVIGIALARLGEIRALAPSATRVAMLAAGEVEDPALAGDDLTELEQEHKHARSKLEPVELLIAAGPR